MRCLLVFDRRSYRSLGKAAVHRLCLLAVVNGLQYAVTYRIVSFRVGAVVEKLSCEIFRFATNSWALERPADIWWCGPADFVAAKPREKGAPSMTTPAVVGSAAAVAAGDNRASSGNQAANRSKNPGLGLMYV